MQIIRQKDPLFRELWEKLWQSDSLQHPFYQTFTREWFKTFEPNAKQVEDLSFIVVCNGKPVLGALLMVYFDKHGKYRLSCSGKNIIFIEDSDCDDVSQKRAHKKLRTEMDKILDKYPIASLIFWDHLYNNQLSFFGRYLLERGAIATPYLTQVINLVNETDVLHSNLRRSFKSLINWGNKNLKIKVINHKSITVDDIEKFRLLHLHAAGRETRSKKSWELQYDMVVNHEAFLMLGELDQELVSGVFMLTSPEFCYYGISASKRELFEKPMSHALLWDSILHAKHMGCRSFEMGEHVFVNQANKVPYGTYSNIAEITKPNEKELNVCKFKKGFGGPTIVRLDIRLHRS